MYLLIFIKNTDCFRMRGAISLVDLLDMRCWSEKHFPHTLLQNRPLVALFQGGEQLLMSLHNIADVAHQLTVRFFRQTDRTHKKIDDTYNILKHLFVLKKYLQRSRICVPSNLMLQQTSHYLTWMGKGMYHLQESIGCMSETLEKSNINQNSIFSLQFLCGCS